MSQMGGCLSQVIAASKTQGDQDLDRRQRENELITTQMERAFDSSDVREDIEVRTDQHGHRPTRSIVFPGRHLFYMSQVVQSDLWTTVHWESQKAKYTTIQCLDSVCGERAFEIAIRFGASAFVMACLDAPAGTFERNWSVAAEYAKSKGGGIHWLARLNAPCLQRLFKIVPPCDGNNDDARGYMHTLVDTRTHRAIVPPAWREPPAWHWLPRIDVFRAYLQHSHLDGTGISITCEDENGKTPAERMREYNRPLAKAETPPPEGAPASAEEDKTIAKLLTKHEESVRRYLALLGTTIGGAVKGVLLSDLIRFVEAYLVTPPASPTIRHREYGAKTLAAAVTCCGTAAATAPTYAPR